MEYLEISDRPHLVFSANEDSSGGERTGRIGNREDDGDVDGRNMKTKRIGREVMKNWGWKKRRRRKERSERNERE